MTKYGLIISKPEPQDYVLGGLSKLPREVLQPDGQWDKYLVEKETQSKMIETQNCTAFGTTSALEIILERKKVEKNFSDRYVGIIANTDPYRGNTPHAVAQAIRHFGLVPEEMLPFEDFDKPEDYYKPKPPTQDLLDEGKRFLEEYKILHEYVPLNVEAIKESLQYSPVGISVFAWYRQGDIYTKPQGQTDNHWVVCYGYDDEKKAWKVFDSYDSFTKLYSYDAKIMVAKRFYIEKKADKVALLKQKKSALLDLIRLIKLFLKRYRKV
jgi:hypothetical protein